ncbi:hypothetical protein E4416_09005 [Stenotrophomonas maltophilia]|uniref:hypothetical protein n=1 Tax=Stenotrophomonas maltophilia TaxID=40324 RepID=UPI0011109581|nr:hypothetical protein [Stenotrophomonas maltophilia]TIK70876.1 hypothetical protein E4418_03155 [Stenotrophomonas maltophilia]TIK71927.1 hypothetical protein E4416_09005 [Stenotrophomonas maltophilia]
MSNDNKTLADVQPGGRVRLGDPRRQWLEIRGLASAIVKNLESFAASPHKAAWCGALDDSLTFADQIEKDAAAAYEAALSAHTSPGGQDLLVEAAEFARSVLAEIYATYQIKIGPFASQAQLANVKLRAALAARQPVGEPVDAIERIARLLYLRSCNRHADGSPYTEWEPMDDGIKDYYRKDA